MDSYPRDDRGRPPIDSFRRRSPDRRRDRSRSPVTIDRYQPDRSRDSYYRQRDDVRRRSSPPPVQPGIDRYVPGQQEVYVPAVTTNPLPNPFRMDAQAGFAFFAEWWRFEQLIKEERERAKNGGRKPILKGEREAREERAREREQIQTAYDTYKEQFQSALVKAFVEKHKNAEWFKERYDMACRAELRAKLLGPRSAAFSAWQRNLEGGMFDDFTLEGIYKSESNGAGGVIEKEEGETTAANEVLGVGDLLPSKGGDLRDEFASEPTLLIKTIAPTVRRDKLTACFKEHLGEGPGGFKMLSLSDPNPNKKFHRIGWIVVHASDEVPSQDEAESGRIKVEISDGSGQALTPMQRALEAVNGKTVFDEERGDFTCHVGVHEPPPAPRKKALWDLFSAPERVERDAQLAERLVAKIDSECGSDWSGLDLIEARVEELRSRGVLQPVNAPSTAKKADDLEEGEDVALDEEEEGLFDDEVDDEDLLVRKKKLDMIIEYLRRVHNFCFFCVFESDSVHELMRKCPGGHLRRPRSSLTSAAKTAAKATTTGDAFPFKRSDKDTSGDTDMDDGMSEDRKPKLSVKSQQQLHKAFNWVRTYEDKLLQILEPEHADLKKLGGKPVEEGLEEDLAKFVKQEDENKFRCKVPECAKLFKGQNFWRKHVEKRHTEWLEKMQQDIELVNRYVLDPSHIASGRTDATSNGHFAVPSNMAMGTPRGFNAGTMPFNMNMTPGGFNPPTANFQAYLNMSGMPPNWSNMGGDEERHQVGAMRRTGSRFSNRSGPYDRPSRDGRSARFGGGRLTPPRGGMRREGPPAPISGAPGGMGGGMGGMGAMGGMGGMPGGMPGAMGTMGGAMGAMGGPPGRSLKSYEDLDAVDGGPEGELNY